MPSALQHSGGLNVLQQLYEATFDARICEDATFLKGAVECRGPSLAGVWRSEAVSGQVDARPLHDRPASIFRFLRVLSQGKLSEQLVC